MLKEEHSVLNIDINNWARPCDTCGSAACTVYCRADSAYLCAGCDARIHAANRDASRHQRVWVCEACERAPAAFLCKADNASLCATCDADVHSANPLARRHRRVPILPISGAPLVEPVQEQDNTFEPIDEGDEAASWLLLNPAKNSTNHNNSRGFSHGGEAVDEYLDLIDYNTCNNDSPYTDGYNNEQQNYNGYSLTGYGRDSVVPVQNEIKSQNRKHHHDIQLGIEYDTSKTGYGFPASISHSVSVSSMDVGVVPESSDVSISHPRPPKGTIDIFSTLPIQMPIQLTPMDREARVLRYREKKKTRRFEKTIRYASRKAYAETRPRIKGRFAKRTDVEVEVDQLFSTSLLAEGGYGIVPSY